MVEPSGTSRPLDVLIAGGGIAAIEAALALRALADERVRLTMLAPSTEFRYRPLAVAEPFDPLAHFELPLETVAADTGARLRHGALARVDADARYAWTSSGERLEYDLLLVAIGAHASESVPGAVTFWAGPGGGAFTTLLEELRSGSVRHVAFAAPSGVTWSLPLYELALLTAADVAARGIDARLTIVTAEPRPLAVFEGEASRAVAVLLDERGIEVITRRHPVTAMDGELAVKPAGSIPADAVVALPSLSGPQVDGLPRDRHGFVPTDIGGVVSDVDAVFAAGDATTFPVKQGGLAAQQADAAATTIAVLAGARVEPKPFQPVLRGRLLTGGEPLFMRTELRGGRGATSTISTEPLWWPAAKIFGRYAGPYLAERAERLVGA